MPYSSKHCNKSFSRSSVCKERSHTGVKLFTCKFCKKCFNQPSHCKKHERTHTGTGKKPYTCKHCKKGFSQSLNCKIHEGTHTGEKPYTCKHCNKGFRQLSNCRRHEQKHAKDSSLKRKQHGQNLKLTIPLQEPTTTHARKKSGMLMSSTEENLSQVESLTCWICQKEFSREPCLIQHYDDHMRYSQTTRM